MSDTWTSKLGVKYSKSDIEGKDREHHRQLEQLRKEPENSCCAECGATGTCWASVNLGVFICFTCADIHRGIGTHISKVKGCTGTYLWGPDEIERMQKIGNRRAKVRYGGGLCPQGASTEERKAHCARKYEGKLEQVLASLEAETQSAPPAALRTLQPKVEASKEAPLQVITSQPAPAAKAVSKEIDLFALDSPLELPLRKEDLSLDDFLADCLGGAIQPKDTRSALPQSCASGVQQSEMKPTKVEVGAEVWADWGKW